MGNPEDWCIMLLKNVHIFPQNYIGTNININIYYIQIDPVTGWKTSSQTIGYRMCQNQNRCSNESMEQVQIIQYKIYSTQSLNTTKHNHNRNFSARWKTYQPFMQ
jgi:hypothetical protein